MSSTMGNKTTILFLTNSEYGEANVILAAAYELLLHDNCDVHIASYSMLEKRVRDMNNGAFGEVPNPATFHLFPGDSNHERRLKKFNIASIDHRPGVKEPIRMYGVLDKLAGARTGEEYVQRVEECQRIIKEVIPNVTVVGNYLIQGIDACRIMEMKYMILSPCTFMEIKSDQQSMLGAMAKFPAKGSGYQFPLRRREIPANIYLNFRLISTFVRSAALKDCAAERTKRGLPGKLPLYKGYVKTVTYLLPTTPESDFPIKFSPNLVPCGPIIVPSPPLGVTDPELEAWLKVRPTVLINLGSFLTPDPDHTRELAKGIQILFDQISDVQVLWKLTFKGDNVPEEVQDLLSEHIASGRLKIEKWLKAEPSAIVLSGLISLVVHHGGANTYFEVVSAGIPHIILPPWFDTYEFAARVEYLGIGIYGSKNSKSAPKAEANELGLALVTLMGDGEHAKKMREKAKQLGVVCNAYGGRKKAAEKILEVAAE